ncbi:MAG: hypothetical protein ACLTSO_02200 [Coprococcus sp.]
MKFEQTVVVTGFDSIAQLALNGFQRWIMFALDRIKPFGPWGTKHPIGRMDVFVAICPG